MAEKLVVTQPEMSHVLPFDGEFAVIIGGRIFTTFQGKRGDRISLHAVIPEYLSPVSGAPHTDAT